MWRHLRCAWRGAKHRQTALEHLWQQTENWLQSTGEVHWLAYGTLLGWWRERRILRHDLDVDIGLPVSAYPALCAAAPTLPPPLRLRDSSHRHHGPKLYIESGGWEVDLYFYVPEGDHLRSTERSSNPGDTASFPAQWIHPLQQVAFAGKTTWVPADAESLLRHHYHYLGPNAVRDPVTRFFRPRQ